MSEVKYYFFTQKYQSTYQLDIFLLKHYHSNCQLTLMQSFDLPIVTSTWVARPYPGFLTLCKVYKQLWDLRIILNTHDISKWNYSGLVNHACKKTWEWDPQASPRRWYNNSGSAHSSYNITQLTYEEGHRMQTLSKTLF